jgi:hypothetical protein
LEYTPLARNDTLALLLGTKAGFTRSVRQLSGVSCARAQRLREWCAAEARLGYNNVSVVVRLSADGCRLAVVATHALDEVALSRELGVELTPLV